ncbi:MAG: hypothetical protein ABFE07_19725 [Armatimonadia bacterium]
MRAWPAVLVILLVGPVPAQQRMDAETLLKGLQHRKEAITTLAGRVVIGNVSAAKAAETPSDIALLDFARTGDRYRAELRVVRPAGNYYCFDTLTQGEDTPKAIDPHLMYRSKVREGNNVWAYDRSVNRVTFSSADPPDSPPWWQGVRLASDIDEFVTPRYLNPLGDFLIRSVLDGTMTAVVQGTDKIEGHECYRVYIASRNPQGEARGYFRVWIAPDMNFGAPRCEQADVTGNGTVTGCYVVNARNWRQDHEAGFWLPDTCQSDSFQYRGYEEWGYQQAGWTNSRLVASIELTTEPAAVARALPLRYPFDCTSRDRSERIGGDTEPDPTTYINELAPLLTFAAPDALGVRLLNDRDVDAVFAQ